MQSQNLCCHRLWSHCLLLASPTNPVPLAVSATARLSLFSTGITRRLLCNTTHRPLRHITGRLLSRLSARNNTMGRPTGYLLAMMTNTTRHPDLTALPYTGRLPAPGEQSIFENEPGRRSAAKLLSKDEARGIAAKDDWRRSGRPR